MFEYKEFQRTTWSVLRAQQCVLPHSLGSAVPMFRVLVGVATYQIDFLPLFASLTCRRNVKTNSTPAISVTIMSRR